MQFDGSGCGIDELSSTEPLPSADEIKAMCRDVRAEALARTDCDPSELRAELASRFPVLEERMPRLFNAVLDASFPLGLLDFMLAKSDGLRPDGDGIVQADTDVYGKLREVYGKTG